MAASKSQKIQAEIEKVKAKINEQQARLKELEKNKLEAENSEIVDIVRGLSISLEELPLVLQQLREGTSGQSVQRMSFPVRIEFDSFFVELKFESYGFLFPHFVYLSVHLVAPDVPGRQPEPYYPGCPGVYRLSDQGCAGCHDRGYRPGNPGAPG